MCDEICEKELNKSNNLPFLGAKMFLDILYILCNMQSEMEHEKAEISQFFQFHFQDSKVEAKKPRSWEKSQGVATLLVM